MQEKQEERLGEALLKVALGYQLAEVTEEYAEVDGELKLTKRKKTKKDIPPDLKAVQLLLASESGEGFEGLSDEELEREKERLLAALKQAEGAQKTSVKKAATVKRTTKKTSKRAAKKPSKTASKDKKIK